MGKKIKTMRYHYTHIRMAKIQNADNTKFWKGYGATGTLIHCWWECKMELQNGTATLKENLADSYKTKLNLIIRSRNCASWYLGAKELKTMTTQKHAYR